MLQTAPVLLVFPPTIGPFAKVEGDPLRFDFTGYVFKLQVPGIFFH
jgi:oligosaccharyltransferase complex subunit gamma